jgi:hypothetical protein
MPCLKFSPKPDAFCETVIAWEGDDGEPVPITEVYCGPEEYSSVGPFFGWDFRHELYQEGSVLTLLVFTYKVRNDFPDKEASRQYDLLKIFRSEDGRRWELRHEVHLGSFVTKSR